MRFFVLAAVLCCALVSGFRLAPRPTFNSLSRLRMSDAPTPEPSSIIPVDKENVENAAAFTGGILGFVLAGPVGGIILAALTNYVSKKENESGEALRGIGKTVVESVNFLRKLNGKYQVTDKVAETVSKAVDTGDNEVIGTVKTASSKVKELNDEYDLVGKGKDVIGVAKTLSEAALEKIEELNSKYDFIELAKKTANTAVEKIKEQTEKSD